MKKYQVQGENEFGQLYTDKGQIQHYSTKQKPCLKHFDTLISAQKYAQAFVRRYPHVVCHISHTDDTEHCIETHKDDEYWEWHKQHRESWTTVQHKMNRLRYGIASLIIGAFGVGITLVIHFLSYLQLSLYVQLMVVPVLLILSWFVLVRF